MWIDNLCIASKYQQLAKCYLYFFVLEAKWVASENSFIYLIIRLFIDLHSSDNNWYDSLYSIWICLICIPSCKLFNTIHLICFVFFFNLSSLPTMINIDNFAPENVSAEYPRGRQLFACSQYNMKEKYSTSTRCGESGRMNTFCYVYSLLVFFVFVCLIRSNYSWFYASLMNILISLISWIEYCYKYKLHCSSIQFQLIL